MALGAGLGLDRGRQCGAALGYAGWSAWQPGFPSWGSGSGGEREAGAALPVGRDISVGRDNDGCAGGVSDFSSDLSVCDALGTACSDVESAEAVAGSFGFGDDGAGTVEGVSEAELGDGKLWVHGRRKKPRRLWVAIVAPAAESGEAFLQGFVNQSERVDASFAAFEPEPISVDVAGLFGRCIPTEIEGFGSAATGESFDEELPSDDFRLAVLEKERGEGVELVCGFGSEFTATVFGFWGVKTGTPVGERVGRKKGLLNGEMEDVAERGEFKVDGAGSGLSGRRRSAAA